jgi:Domain of Unknown Function (DUF1080)
MHRLFTLFSFMLLTTTQSAVAADKPQLLFNGTDLKGWEGDTAVWSVEDKVIVGRTSADTPLTDNTFLIWKGGNVDDFRLELEYKIDGGNSGVQYRSEVLIPDKWVVGGYQADIDSGPTYTGILYEEKGRGIITKRGERRTIEKDGTGQTEKIGDLDKLQKAVREGDWNKYVIEARGRKLRHTINGKLMSETVDRDKTHRDDSGILALQVHAGPPMTVRFRNIRLEQLDSKSAGSK